MIKFQSVCKTFDQPKTDAVINLSLEIKESEFFVLLGSSGCGKTTTLKMINGLLQPSSGKIEVFGKKLSEFDPVQLRHQIGYVFQGIGLFPHMTVSENVSIVLRLMGKSSQEQEERAKELLEIIKMPYEKFSSRFPQELSGGQMQRVGVARALAAKPKCLLMDEPFGALDALTRENLQEEILRIQRLLKITIVLVTHDLMEALRLADRIGVMHDGNLEQEGTGKQILENPQTEFVRNLFQKPVREFENYFQKSP